MMNLSKKTTIILVIIICVLQLILAIAIGNKKNFLFFDEVFSYPAANNVESVGDEFPQLQWIDSKWFDEYMGVDQEHQFDYAIPYNNQMRDVHPPLFYFFLHTVSSLIPGKFSMMAGLGINIIFFIISTIILYFLGKEVFGNPICGLVAGFLYAVSYGGLNTFVYIRMYMLMTMMALLHLLVYLKYFEQDRIPLKGYILLLITMLGGVLSQYYFLFIAFALGLWYTLKFFFEKKYQILIKYLSTITLSAVISLLIWPSMIHHLFGGVRGKEAQGNLMDFGGYFTDLREMLRILSNEMFTNMLGVILAGLAILLAINYLKGNKLKKLSLSKGTVVLFTVIIYLALVTKLAPYQVERYVMPIYPLVNLLVVGAAVQLLVGLIPGHVAVSLCVIGFTGLSAIHILMSGVPYTYEKNQDNIERFVITDEYGDGYALYISDNGECHQFYAAQVLRKYKAYYHVYDLNAVGQVKEDMQLIENADELVVYVSKTLDMQKVNAFVEDIFGDKVLNDENCLDEDSDWNVYILNF